MTQNGEALRSVGAFLDAYRKMGGLDPEDIYSVARDGRVFTLRMSDLVALAGEGLDGRADSLPDVDTYRRLLTDALSYADFTGSPLLRRQIEQALAL